MPPLSPRIFIASVFLLSVVCAAHADDLKMVTVTRLENGDPYVSTRYVQGERMRIEWRDQSTWKPGVPAYGPPRATIYQCDAKQVMELNLKSHEYSVMELNDECRSKSTPPPSPIKGTVDVYIESTDTGERQQILGRTARHIITHQRQVAGPGACWRNGEMERDGWYIDMEEQPITQRFRRGTNNELANVIMTGANCRDKIEVHRSGLERPGVPVKWIQTSRSSGLSQDGTSKEYTTRLEMEVTELSDAPLDAALFELPAGFTRVAKINVRTDVPVSVAVGYWWHHALKTVRSWF